MFNLIQLTINEWLKMTKKKSFIVQLILILVVAIGVAAIINAVVGKEYMSLGNFGRILISLSGGGFLYLVLCLVQASGIVAKEHQQGTIKLLLIRAHTRSAILTSKFIALVVYMVFLAIYTLLISYLVGALFFDNVEGLMLEQAFTDLGFTMVYTFAYVSIAVMLSTLLKSTAGSISILLITALFIDQIVVSLLGTYKYAKFILFFNIDFSQFADGGTPFAEGLTPTFSAFMYLLYVAVFMLITFVVFKKRDVS